MLLPELAPEAARRLHGATVGNPLALLELAADAPDLALAPDGVPVLVSARISRAFLRVAAPTANRSWAAAGRSASAPSKRPPGDQGSCPSRTEPDGSARAETRTGSAPLTRWRAPEAASSRLRAHRRSRAWHSCQTARWRGLARSVAAREHGPAAWRDSKRPVCTEHGDQLPEQS